MLGSLLVVVSISVGAAVGWWLGHAGGIMVAYFCAVFGASFGLYWGRRLQRRIGQK